MVESNKRKIDESIASSTMLPCTQRPTVPTRGQPRQLIRSTIQRPGHMAKDSESGVRSRNSGLNSSRDCRHSPVQSYERNEDHVGWDVDGCARQHGPEMRHTERKMRAEHWVILTAGSWNLRVLLSRSYLRCSLMQFHRAIDQFGLESFEPVCPSPQVPSWGLQDKEFPVGVGGMN